VQTGCKLLAPDTWHSRRTNEVAWDVQWARARACTRMLYTGTVHELYTDSTTHTQKRQRRRPTPTPPGTGGAGAAGRAIRITARDARQGIRNQVTEPLSHFSVRASPRGPGPRLRNLSISTNKQAYYGHSMRCGLPGACPVPAAGTVRSGGHALAAHTAQYMIVALVHTAVFHGGQLALTLTPSTRPLQRFLAGKARRHI